ncbi:ferric reductase-like transmembrane domain-containing protein, partial [Erythrobacter sp. YJ-T3-07]|nr:ferric reductase-like transmembrane domain-containing protein [Erythrobacter sp. YJ-T3-07]
MAGANFALVVFLALKNTPLAILTSYSYERLNPLHQVSGYATIIFMVIH